MLKKKKKKEKGRKRSRIEFGVKGITTVYSGAIGYK